MITYIYSLIDPETQEVRYVGKSNTPGKRLIAHICTTHEDCNPYKQNWIKQLKEKGFRPILSIIEETTLDLWPEREIYWIDFYRSMGNNLTNLKDGGLGGGLLADSTKKLIGEKNSIRMADQRVKDHLREIFGRKIIRSDGKELGSIKTAAIDLGIQQQTLRKYIDSGEEVNGFRYFWLNVNPKRSTTNASKIRCIETGVEYDSIMAAALAYKTNRRAIRDSLRSARKVKGHNFEYVDKSKVKIVSKSTIYECIETGDHYDLAQLVTLTGMLSRNILRSVRVGFAIKGFHYRKLVDK